MQGTDPGAQQVSTALGSLGELGDVNRQKAWREATGRGYGAGSTAGIRAGLGAMREGDLMNMLTQAQIQLDQINKQRGFQQQGAQGLMNMPSYFGQPSSVEMGLLGLKNPRDIANMQAQTQGLGMQGNMLNTMLAGSWDEMMMKPGWGQTILSPMLNALMGGLGMAIPGLGG